VARPSSTRSRNKFYFFRLLIITHNQPSLLFSL
jgi:hypothetical protein